MSSPQPTGQALIDLAKKQSPIPLQGGLPVAIQGLSVALGIITTIIAIFSLLTFIPECVFAFIASRYGLGTRDSELNELVMAQAALMLGNWQMFYAASTVLVKAGIAVTLLRLADQRKYRLPILAALISTPIFTAVVVVLLLITCKPVGAQWDLSLGPCPLHNWLAILSYPFTAMTIVLDWSCAVIPWLLIRKLQLNRRIKRSLIVVLGLGAVASIGAIARLPYLKYYTITEDQLYHTANIVLWSVFENGIGIVAASLPPVHRLFKYYNDTTPVKNSGGGALETIGGTPLRRNDGSGTFELSPVSARAPTTKVTAMRRGTWDRLQDEESGEEGITVHKTFAVVEAREEADSKSEASL